MRKQDTFNRIASHVTQYFPESLHARVNGILEIHLRSGDNLEFVGVIHNPQTHSADSANRKYREANHKAGV
jgi:hypothetical protein